MTSRFLACQNSSNALLPYRKESLLLFRDAENSPRSDNSVIDGGQYKSVDENGTKLLHAIEGKRTSAGTIAVQKSHIRIEPHAL